MYEASPYIVSELLDGHSLRGVPTLLDVVRIALSGDHVMEPIVQAPFVEQNADISPDDRWIACEPTEAGRRHIFIRPFPDVRRGTQASRAGQLLANELGIGFGVTCTLTCLGAGDLPA